MLDPSTLDAATSYSINTLPGRWRPIWIGRSEIVFAGAPGKLLVAADQLIEVGPGQLRFASTHLDNTSDHLHPPWPPTP